VLNVRLLLHDMKKKATIIECSSDEQEKKESEMG
jgi:hypothetical protein